MKIVDERVIAASPETVWSVITGFSQYGEWNPFVTACEAELVPGSDIDMQVCLGGRTRRQVEVVSEVEEGRRFVYRMKPVPLLLKSCREHELWAEGPNLTRYRSTFTLEGWVAPLVAALLGGQLRSGFRGMSDGVKRRAETRPPSD